MSEADEGRRLHGLHCRRLSDLIAPWPGEFADTDVDRIRSMRCPVDDDGYGEHVLVRASDAEVEDWHRATATVVERVRDTYRELEETRVHYQRPWRSQRRFQAAVDRLYGQLRYAYQSFEREAGEFTDRIVQEQERQRQEAERREHDRLEARQVAMTIARRGDPVWRYRIRRDTVPLGDGAKQERTFLDLCLDPLDRWRRAEEGDVTGLTYETVNRVLRRLRAEDPYLIVLFQLETGEALRDWSGTDDSAAAWQRLTGTLIQLWPRTPEEERHQVSRSYNPPITDYSPPTF